MSEISILLILVLMAYTAIGVLDQISIQIGPYTPLFAATVTGAFMGQMDLGLKIGATLQLMTLGVATYGGATVPDYLTGAILGTAYAALSGEGFEYGIAIAIPVGLLLTQLDILGRMTNSFFQHYADRMAEQGNAKGVEMANVLGAIPWILSRIIPVFIGLYFGEAVVTAINNFIPVWFMNGLKAAGAILPALGMAILMRYLPLKKYFPYFIIGFVMIAYGKTIFSLVAVALVGTALAFINHRRSATVAVSAGVDLDDEEVELDE